MDPARPHTIVLVEDADEVRELLQAVLERAGFEVRQTGDPLTAVELVKQAQPDLVLCDIAMPRLDGYGVVRALQADPATARYPVVFLTARKEFTERVRAFRFGVVDYLTKPISPPQLVDRVTRILAGLERRSGAVHAQGPGTAQALFQQVQEEARTGVLTVDGPAGGQRLVVRTGDVVDGSADVSAARGARFEELDARREALVAEDAAPPASAGREPPSFDDVPRELRTALVADDNPLFRRFLRDVLQLRGFVVHEATTAAEAVRLTRELSPRIVVLDVRLPDRDGFEVCRELRRHAATRDVPVVFLSGWAGYEERHRGLESGADEFVSKQTPVNELLIRVQLLMKRYAVAGAARSGTAAMEGRLELIGAPGLLQMCHLTGLTGTLRVRRPGGGARVVFESGRLCAADGDTTAGRDAVFDLLAWSEGRWTFEPAMEEGTPVLEPTDFLILEGCRLLDERASS